MRTIIALMLASLLVQAQETENEDGGKPAGGEGTNPDVVKAVRYVLSAKTKKEQDQYYEELFKRGDLDWPSVKKGLQTGPYYQKPLVTEVGIRHSGKHMGVRLRGSDGKERGFSVYVPAGYTAQDDGRIPVLFYLHHYCSGPINAGAAKAEIAIRRFDQLCEKHNVLFVAPYTGEGAEWWTAEGLKLIAWTLEKVKSIYNIDENRVGLLGPLDAGDAVWYVAQKMPGTWNVIMPLSGDPYGITAMVEPIYLGTIDRMDVLMGVPGQLRSSLGDKNIQSYLDWLKPHFDKRMRITLSVHPEANSDAHYLDKIQEQVLHFLVDDAHKRKPLAEEVDIETSDGAGLRSLWLYAEEYDENVKPPRGQNFPSTRLVWTAPQQKEPKKRLGIGLAKREWPVGQQITSVAPQMGADRAKIRNGDVLLEIDGTKVTKDTDLAKLLEGKAWNDEVEVLLAREGTEKDLEGARREQRQMETIRKKIAELKAAGKPVPADPLELLTDEPAPDDGDGEDEEEDDGESVIEMGGGDGDAGADPKKTQKREETSFFVFRRWIKILRPEGVLIRGDFGAGWDRKHRDPAGVRVASVTPGSLADRSGLKPGDVIVGVLGREIRSMGDLRAAFADWKFEKEPEGERSVTFDLKRVDSNRQWSEASVTVRWDVPRPYRVDARWDKRDNALHILVRHASRCTVYLTDEFVKPGEDFHVFVNNIPYHDLMDPASRPEYPNPHHGGRDESLRRMRLKRAKIEGGWKPDFKLAVDDALQTRDRGLVLGAKLDIDFSKSKDGFEKSRTVARKPENKRSQKLAEAYAKHKGEAVPEEGTGNSDDDAEEPGSGESEG